MSHQNLKKKKEKIDVNLIDILKLHMTDQIASKYLNKKF